MYFFSQKIIIVFENQKSNPKFLFELQNIHSTLDKEKTREKVPVFPLTNMVKKINVVFCCLYTARLKAMDGKD